MRVRQREDAATVRRPRLGLLAFSGFPPADIPVLAGGSHDFRIVTPSQGGDGGAMAGQREEFLAVLRIPQIDAAIAIRAGEEFPIGTERNRRYPIGMFLDLVQ